MLNLSNGFIGAVCLSGLAFLAFEKPTQPMIPNVTTWERQEFESLAERDLERLRLRIEVLGTPAEIAENQGQESLPEPLARKIQVLERHHDDAERELERLRAGSAAGWDERKRKLGDTLLRLERQIDRTRGISRVHTG